MNKEQFVRDRRADWDALEELLDQRALGKRATGDPREFSRLMRAVSHDLSTATSRDWGADFEQYLNELVTRGHNSFYGAVQRRSGVILRFFTTEFPALLRREKRYFLVASALFFVPFFGSAIAVALRPELAERVLPRTVLVMFDQMYSERQERGADEAGASSMMAGYYVHNNIGIAFRCFATGVFLGIGTVFFLLYNGIFIGAITGSAIAAGNTEAFLSFVAGHGSFELIGIVIAGAGGLVLGDAVVRPGPYARIESLRLRAADAVRLALGAAGLIATAAVIEAFWSPSGVSAQIKYWVGGALWLLVALYLGFGGRGRARATL